jgi:hypothetical protein
MSQRSDEVWTRAQQGNIFHRYPVVNEPSEIIEQYEHFVPATYM